MAEIAQILHHVQIETQDLAILTSAAGDDASSELGDLIDSRVEQLREKLERAKVSELRSAHALLMWLHNQTFPVDMPSRKDEIIEGILVLLVMWHSAAPEGDAKASDSESEEEPEAS